MTAISGFVRGCNLLSSVRTGLGTRKVYELAVSTTTTYINTDTVVITGVPSRIQERLKNGKTFNYIDSVGSQPTLDSSGAAVYCSLTITNSSGTLTIQLCGADPTVSSATCGVVDGLGLLVVGYES